MRKPWAGKSLALAPHTAYIHEPFNINIQFGIISTPFNHWFQYICEENSDQYREVLRKVIYYEYPFIKHLTEAPSLGMVKKITIDQLHLLQHKIRNDTPIVKDPIALFSAEWLSQTFDMNVLVMIRHPAAFCSSLKLKNWKFDFNHFLNQPLLMDRYLGVFEKEIRKFSKNEQDIIDQGILLWNCIHHTINIYQQNHLEWLFVKHENLSHNPVDQFQTIYKAFNLDFTPESKSAILKSTGTHNPVEQQRNNEFLRNSKENILNWQSRLSQSEIERIRENTYKIASNFYNENEW